MSVCISLITKTLDDFAVMSAALNLHVLSNLMAARRSVGLSRLNTLLLQLVLADLLVRD